MGHLEANIIAQTSGFAAGTALSALLLALVHRSGGTGRGPRYLFAICILIANGAGLVKYLALLADPNLDPVLEGQMRSIGFAAAAFLPCSILLAWRDNAISDTRRAFGKWLVGYSILSGIAIAGTLILSAWEPSWTDPGSTQHLLSGRNTVANLTFYNALALLLLGGVTLLPGTLTSSRDKVAVGLMAAGLSISAASAAIAAYVHLPGLVSHILDVARFQSIILLVIGVFFFFSRFRAADIFARSAIRLLLAWGLAMAGAFFLFGLLSSIVRNAPLPAAAEILCAATVFAAGIALYMRIGTWVDVFVERRIFRKRDPRHAMQEFRHQLGSLDSKPAILSLVHSVATDTLAMKGEEIHLEVDAPYPERTAHDLVIPIPSRLKLDRITVSLNGNRRTVLTTEADLLHEIALHAGKRLDDLEREEERMERVRLESLLGRQLVEAELRALRAQINPHFLFNSLNTIASLIISEPEKAERITVRLGSMFRYVLTHADRPLSALEDEIGFLRTFLEIEQIRFGDRLSVEFDLEPTIRSTPIPSLILQPLVENAIKHGIAPKIGKSRILVSARNMSNTIFVDIEDNGVGLSKSRNIDRRLLAELPPNTGIGLQNVRERLHTLYGSDARLCLQDLEQGGCRARLEIPVYEVHDADSHSPGR
jgi:two-component system LytT family sensor kinase